MKIITTLGVVALLMVGLVYFVLISSPAHDIANDAADMQSELSHVTTKDQVPSTLPLQGSGSMRSLLEQKRDLECAIVIATQDTTTEGTYFVSNGKLRADVLVPSPDLGGTILSSMIMIGDELYVWSEINGEQYGVKMQASKIDPVTSGAAPVGLDQSLTYDCKVWPLVDNTVFEPPHDVLFKDMTDLQRAGMEYGTVYEEGAEMP